MTDPRRQKNVKVALTPRQALALYEFLGATVGSAPHRIADAVFAARSAIPIALWDAGWEMTDDERRAYYRGPRA